MQDFVVILYVVALTILFAFGLHGLVMVYYYHKTKKNESPDSYHPEELPLVTIQLPLFNEMYVVERLMESICQLDYPINRMEIQVLDDSTDETVHVTKALVDKYKELGFQIEYIHRTNREGYKAGALKHGLHFAKGEFVAIFDADFVPKPEFLKTTIPYFQNPKIGMVQTRWEHLNEEYSFLTRAQALALDGHFVIEQQVRNKAGFFINFNGTAGIWRRTCIEDAGNWQPDTLAEDLDLSFRAQLKGWKFIFLNDFTSPAELPADINSLKSQQFRWTKGAVEAAKKLLPSVWKSNLPLKIKLECTVHLTSNIVFPFIIIVAMLNIPMLIIKQNEEYANLFVMMSIFVLASVSTFMFYLHAQKDIHTDWRRRLLLFPVFMAGSMGLAVNNTKAVFEALWGKKTEFVRTPKFKLETGNDQWKEKKNYVAKKVGIPVIIELAFALYFFVGICMSLYYNQISAIPFQLLFFTGFATVGLLSLRHRLTH